MFRRIVNGRAHRLRPVPAVGPAFLAVACAIVALLWLPAPAEAQWYAGAFLGGNHSQAADVTVDQPASSTSLRFDQVSFEARPLKSPQYYGYWVGRTFGQARRVGLEVEVIHLKMYAQTGQIFPVSGQAQGVDVSGTATPMDAFVQRYAMSHGLNFILINVMTQRPIGSGRVRLVARGGIGPTVPHAESTVGGQSREGYEWGGVGLGGGGGVNIALTRTVSANLEYKFTFAKPEILIVDGTGRTTAATHQVILGLAFGMPH